MHGWVNPSWAGLVFYTHRVGTVPHNKMLRSIELFATVVAPAVRKAVGKAEATES